jgi:hypothetical protein
MRWVLLAAMTMGIQSWTGRAMFVFEETQKVPIGRLFTNLQQRLSANTNSFELTYQLARLHAMAYARELTEFDVNTNQEKPVFASPGADTGIPRDVHPPASEPARGKAMRHLTNAISLYQRAMPLLWKSTNFAEMHWYIAPTQLGLAWCWDQSGNRAEALAAYRKALRYAWHIEVTGDFSIKDVVQDAWNDVRGGQNPIHSHNRGFVGPGVCFSEEIIGYLLKLLDPVKDGREIADLRARQKTLQSMPRAITPIVVPLQRGLNLSGLVDPDAQVPFDLDGSGRCARWGWIRPNAAWLVYDADGTGDISSGLQLFGAVTFWIFWSNGYEALAALDDDGDGVLQGAELDHLALWQDNNGNGISDPGEVKPLAAFGIVALAAYADRVEAGFLSNSCGATFNDGTVRATYDWMAPRMESKTGAWSAPCCESPSCWRAK